MDSRVKISKEELFADVWFLADRAKKAGSFSFNEHRETGVSSNAIVSLAYLGEAQGNKLPYDSSDLQACENMWAKLPAHRKTAPVIAAMDRARNAVAKDRHASDYASALDSRMATGGSEDEYMDDEPSGWDDPTYNPS